MNILIISIAALIVLCTISDWFLVRFSRSYRIQRWHFIHSWNNLNDRNRLQCNIDELNIRQP